MGKSCSPREFLHLAKQRALEGHLPAWRQLLDVSVLRTFYGVGLGFYQMAGYWRRDVTWKDKTGSLSANDYRKVVDHLNPREYRKLSQNKVAEKALLRLFDVPSSEYLGFFDPLSGCSADGRSLRTASDLGRFLAELEGQRRVCFKPVEGWGGRGFEVVKISGSGPSLRLYRVKTDETLDVDAFCTDVLGQAHQGASVIEDFLVQHELMARFNPSSVNTLRIWVIRENGEPPRALLGYLRMGRSGSLVDNQSSGGIVAPIDMTSGRLEAAIDGLPSREVFRTHPDHGASIEGERIPYFKECVALASMGLLAFPRLRFAGLDIAVAPDGPRIIELNVSPDREGAAFVGARSKELFRRSL